MQTFEQFWCDFSERSIEDRSKYFSSLPRKQQMMLVKSFFNDGWDKLIVQNIIDRRLDEIKSLFDIDLINLRIQAVKYNKSFIIERSLWEFIEQYLSEFEEYYDTNIIFGGLVVKAEGDRCNIRSEQGS